VAAALFIFTKIKSVMTPDISSSVSRRTIYYGDTSQQKLEQLQHESNTWKRLLAFMMDENVHLKNRLSDVLKDNFDKELLGQMEVFQTRFVKEDESISLLRHDIATLDKLLAKDIFADSNLLAKANKKLKEVRTNMVVSETKFGKLKSDFNIFLVENL
jgi:hypothetical protein